MLLLAQVDRRVLLFEVHLQPEPLDQQILLHQSELPPAGAGMNPGHYVLPGGIHPGGRIQLEAAQTVGHHHQEGRFG
jgi:hypothetical protein